EVAKGGDNPIENSGLKKARILWDCLLTSCQRLKIGINRQPLFIEKEILNLSKVFLKSLVISQICA
ncbi:hypothetical protein, partial [Eisenbergiella tayi]|uniref:hypothetical protein n=1 Tax=Eisenbergiella tayi TaxID=1432052 RepID=UPI001A9A44FC